MKKIFLVVATLYACAAAYAQHAVCETAYADAFLVCAGGF